MPTSILITGCSSGIGLACAQALKQHGYRVFASARQLSDVAKLRELGLESVQLDVNDPSSITAALKQVCTATGGTLDALFNNAGYVQPGAIEDLTLEHHRAQFETNVFGAMEVIRQVLPIMRKQGHGRIIQNSSILGIVTLPYSGAYNASKFAVEGYLLTLRQELRGSGIHVSLVNPGPISSELRENAYQHYQRTIAGKSCLHDDAYQRMENSYFGPSAVHRKSYADKPQLVAKKVLRIVESKSPSAHYYVGLPAQCLALLHRLLPESWMDWVLRVAVGR